MSPDLVEKLKNIDAIYRSRPGEAARIEHELVSEFLSSGEEGVKSVLQILGDASSSATAIEMALRMVDTSKNEKFIPCMVQFLRKNEDDDLCEMASDNLWEYGDKAAPPLIEALREDFSNKVYSGFLVDALSGEEAREFVESVLNDFLKDPEKYLDWFDLGHFAWKLAEVGQKENSTEMVKKLLGVRGLFREDRLSLRSLQKFLTDSEGYQKELSEEEMRRAELLASLTLRGVLHSQVGDLVPDGPRPVIDDSNRAEYFPLLYQIERLIFEYHQKHPEIKDGDVIELLKNVRDKVWSGYEGKTGFEEAFILGLKLVVFSLSDLGYTKGEVSACISHILNSVKRHREEGCKQSYLEFIEDFFKKRLSDGLESKPRF